MSNFQKRHYEALALVLKQYRSFAGHIQNREQRCVHANEIEVRLADMLQLDNSKFDVCKFLTACKAGVKGH